MTKVSYPFSQSGVITCGGNIGNITLLNHTYQNVIRFNDSENSTEKNNNTNFYFSEHVGIVRKQLIDSVQVWNLKDFYIIQ